jgi:hypothetical protein
LDSAPPVAIVGEEGSASMDAGLPQDATAAGSTPEDAEAPRPGSTELDDASDAAIAEEPPSSPIVDATIDADAELTDRQDSEASDTSADAADGGFDASCPARFTQAATLPFGPHSNGPRWEAVGDLNGDGKLDLVVSGSAADVYLGNGDGTFGSPTEYDVDSAPFSVALGDFDDDGRVDMVMANYNDGNYGTLITLLGNGDGTFGAPMGIPVGIHPLALAEGDFNADGKLDVALCQGLTGLSVLLGNGDGTFQTKATYANLGCSSVASGDFNGDGLPDLAVAGSGVVLGVGDGTFGPLLSSWATAYEMDSVALADLNGDGKLDQAATLTSYYEAAAFLGNGDGTCQPYDGWPTDVLPSSITIGDFNADGALDMATANQTNQLDGNVSVFLGDGRGHFAAQAALTVGKNPVFVIAADFNADGYADLAVANSVSNTISLFLGGPSDCN